jgi:hypothetical protein
MKRAVKIAMSVGTPLLFGTLFFFFVVFPARAPSGGKLWAGGRTIASLQEDDFDRRLLKLQLCQGVKLVADQCTLERRRVCKAMLVHEVESSLATGGHFIKTPVEFRCEDTALPHSGLDSDAVSLRPNAEVSAIHDALGSVLANADLSFVTQYEAAETCEFLTNCKWAMRPQSFSLRKIASCLTTRDALQRKVLLDQVGSMIFGSKGSRNRTLYSNLVETEKN